MHVHVCRKLYVIHSLSLSLFLFLCNFFHLCFSLYIFLSLSEAKRALIHLGYSPVADDTMAESVCAEVKRLGSQSGITQEIVSLQENEMVQYILQRPRGALSTRDYFNNEIR